MTKSEIIDILTKEINCQNTEPEACIDKHCSECPYRVDQETLIDTYCTIIQILSKGGK